MVFGLQMARKVHLQYHVCGLICVDIGDCLASARRVQLTDLLQATTNDVLTDTRHLKLIQEWHRKMGASLSTTHTILVLNTRDQNLEAQHFAGIRAPQLHISIDHSKDWTNVR